MIYISIFILLILTIIYIYKNYIEKYDIDSVFLISLKKDEERRNKIISNINVNYIYSFNGNRINRNYLLKHGILNDNKRQLTKGEIGCYFSHLHMITKAVRHKKIILVLEDDVEIDNNKLENIKKAINEAPKDFKILFVGYNYYEPFSDFKKIDLIYGLQSYVVNGKNISLNELNSLLPIEDPIDIILPLKIKKSYIIQPKICNLNSEFQDESNTQNII